MADQNDNDSTMSQVAYGVRRGLSNTVSSVAHAFGLAPAPGEDNDAYAQAHPVAAQIGAQAGKGTGN